MGFKVLSSEFWAYLGACGLSFGECGISRRRFTGAKPGERVRMESDLGSGVWAVRTRIL